MTKRIAGLVLVVLIFCACGVTEIVEAHAQGRSARDGYETLVVAAALLVASGVVLAVKRRHTHRE